jgi:hypothetical protein
MDQATVDLRDEVLKSISDKLDAVTYDAPAEDESEDDEQAA